MHIIRTLRRILQERAVERNPIDPREELQKRIQDAPISHANAVLSAYELMQQLHDHRNARCTAWRDRPGRRAGGHVVSLVSAPESITALRSVILIGKVLGSINPDVFHAVFGEIQQATQVPGAKPPSLFAPGRRIASPDMRRGLAAAVSVMEVVDRGLAKESASRK